MRPEEEGYLRLGLNSQPLLKGSGFKEAMRMAFTSLQRERSLPRVTSNEDSILAVKCKKSELRNCEKFNFKKADLSDPKKWSQSHLIGNLRIDAAILCVSRE